jgi:hypothetical protein
MGEMHPCVYVYMKEKKKESYIELLSNLKHQCWLRNFLIDPRIVVSDFEEAVIEAFKQMFPGIKLVVVFFILTSVFGNKLKKKVFKMHLKPSQ